MRVRVEAGRESETEREGGGREGAIFGALPTIHRECYHTLSL